MLENKNLVILHGQYHAIDQVSSEYSGFVPEGLNDKS